MRSRQNCTAAQPSKFAPDCAHDCAREEKATPCMEYIRIRGARTHNLKNINLELPRQRLIVLTGPSGSGKSLLALHTPYAEGHRR